MYQVHKTVFDLILNSISIVLTFFFFKRVFKINTFWFDILLF